MGFLYAVLDRIAPITRCSPFRRAIQVVCLALFFYAFFYVCWPYSRHFSQATFRDKEVFPAELFLLIDPLVGVSTLLAGRIVNAATFWWTGAILLICVLIPRAFCGYLCPFGTLIDGFDWLIGRHVARFRRSSDHPRGGWGHLKYYILVAVIVSSMLGVLSSGFVSAIPVLTRGLLFTLARLQLLIVKGPSHLSPADWTLYLSVVLFALSTPSKRTSQRAPAIAPSVKLVEAFARQIPSVFFRDGMMMT
jgi:hypothetical protein